MTQGLTASQYLSSSFPAQGQFDGYGTHKVTWGVSFKFKPMGSDNYSESMVRVFMDVSVVFDNITFNQDIHLGFKNLDAAIDMNYHIELELVKLDLNENTVATLKDIRNIKSQWVLTK